MPVMNKRRRWTGPSSLVNPKNTKHRQSAAVASGRQRPKRKGAKSGAGALTKAALDVHNMQQGDNTTDVEADMKSIATTALGELPENEIVETIFAPVKKVWNSQKPADLETCAVFAAITENIQAKELGETPATYWAALMSTLGSLVDRPSESDSVGAVLYLLSLVCKAVPRAILGKRHDTAVELLAKVIANFGHNPDLGNRPVVKGIVCIKFQLRAAPSTTWKDARTRELAQQLLQFTTDARPKVRHAAQIAVTDILELHAHKKTTFMKLAASFFLDQLSTGRKTADKNVLYVLGILKSTLFFFPPNMVSELARAMANTLLLGNAVATTTCLNAFTAFFASPLSQELPVSTAVDVYKSFVPNCPAVKDVAPRCTWNTTVTRAAVCIAQMSAHEGAAAISATTSSLRECLQDRSKALISSAAANFRTLFRVGVKAMLDKATEADADAVQGCIQSLIQKMDESLSYRFQIAFEEVLRCISDLVDALAACRIANLGSLVNSLVQLHETPGVSCKGNVEDTIKHCIRSIGAEEFLKILPLKLEEEEEQSEFPRAWLLPLLKDNVANNTIAFFSRELFPLAMRMYKRKQAAKEAGQALAAKTYDQLYFQLWLLLPSFFTNPSDTAQTFPTFAKTLGLALRDHNDLRGVICKALVNLITTRGEVEEDAKAIAQYSRNFMQILLRLYLAEQSTDKRAALNNTITAFFGLMSPAQKSPYFASALKQLLEADETSEQCLRLLDIINALVPDLEQPEQLEHLKKVLVYSLRDTVSEKVQKRGYRLLLSVCSASRQPLRRFFLDNLEHLQGVLKNAALSARPGSKGLRLKCIHSILSETPPSRLKATVDESLVEVMLASKEVNEATRDVAYEVLILMCELALAHQGMEGCELTMDDLFQMIVAGLAGTTPHMISATVSCISRVIFEFKEEFSQHLLDQTTAMLLLLLSSPSREVNKSVLEYVSMCMSTLPHDEFDKHMKSVVEAIFNMPKDRRHRHHDKIKILLRRLVRRYGSDRLLEIVPPQHHRLITNIRKAENHQRNKQARMNEQGDDKQDAQGEGRVRTKRGNLSFQEIMDDKDFVDDDDDDDNDVQEFDAQGNLVRKASTVKTFLRDDAEDDTPLDLMDRGILSNITSDIKAASRLKSKASKKKGTKGDKIDSDDIKSLDDGRLLVEDLEELQHGKKGRLSKRHLVPGAGMDMADDFDDDGDDDDAEENEGAGGLTFGRGIHRDRKAMAEQAALEAEKWGDGAYDGEDSSDDEEGGELNTKRARVNTKKQQKQALKAQKAQEKAAAVKGKKNKDARGGLGSEFRSKKAAGDMRKKGQNVMPFAYLPMDAGMLNRRKKAKAESTFKNIVKSAQQGARKGRKSAKRKAF